MTANKSENSKSYLLQVPFWPNEPNTWRCVPATTHSILGYMLPDATFTPKEVNELCGYRGPGTLTGGLESVLRLADLGLAVRWITEWDVEAYATNPGIANRTNFNPVQYDLRSRNPSGPEAHNAREYLNRGLPLEQRSATNADIVQHIAANRLVRLLVDAAHLYDDADPEYSPHTVLAVGSTEESLIIHDSSKGPFQEIGWQRFNAAWEGFSRLNYGLTVFG